MSRQRFWLLGIALAVVAALTLMGYTPYYSAPSTARTHLVSTAIQGDWEVVQGKPQQNMEVSVEQVGTLTLIGTSYEFRPLPNKTASDVEKPIQFLFDSPKGEVQIEYWEGVQATDSVEKLGSLAFVSWCTFKSGSTYFARFLIRVGDSPTTLSIIYPFDAIYFWDIGKNLE